jgi:magnesium transporter
MRVIAIFSIVFLPMTFIAGYFGMNFKEFPIIEKPYGIKYFWIITGISTTLMLMAGTYSIWSKWVARFFRYLYRKRESMHKK